MDISRFKYDALKEDPEERGIFLHCHEILLFAVIWNVNTEFDIYLDQFILRKILKQKQIRVVVGINDRSSE